MMNVGVAYCLTILIQGGIRAIYGAVGANGWRTQFVNFLGASLANWLRDVLEGRDHAGSI